MSEPNQKWSLPWRALQELLASQFAALHAGEPCALESGNDGALDASSWIERARKRQLQTHPSRQ